MRGLILNAESYTLKAIKGFTLVELVVTLGILGILLATGIPSFRSYQKKLILDDAARRVAESIELARTLALAPESGKARSIVAYGVDVDQASGQYRVGGYSEASPLTPSTTVEVGQLTAPLSFVGVPAAPILFRISLAGEPTLPSQGLASIAIRSSALGSRNERWIEVQPTTGQVSVTASNDER